LVLPVLNAHGRSAAEGQSDGFSEVLMERLVPGDIVRLSAGDMVPADLRLLSAKDLFINQAALLARNDDMAGGAPRLRYPFAVVGIGCQRTLRPQRRSNHETAAK
jgi:hypothetical protein